MNRNWFEEGGQRYAAFRPEYPLDLAAALAELAPLHQRAVDVGCGTGQLTRALADHFEEVWGLDPSAEQIAAAAPHPKIVYRVSAAEHLPNTSADLITAAQAAHWFELPKFYAEALRIGKPGAILALICYGALSLDDPALNARFKHFYRHEIGPFWPPERQMVDDGYQTLEFPFDELPPLGLSIRCNWDLHAFFGYVSTWSATRHAIDVGHDMIVFQREFAALWGDTSQKHHITWPLFTRIGRL